MTTFNLADLWETLCDAGPEAECLVAGNVRHTRRSLDEAANRVAHELLDQQVQAGQHVGIYSRNRAEYVEALLGCWKIGVVPSTSTGGTSTPSCVTSSMTLRS
jgi:3-oxocholest-4-en-26-oate---CoA ligase